MSEHYTYHIIFPRGDRSALKVLELSLSMSYELSDYAVASQKTFYDAEEAQDYAKGLARSHGLTYEVNLDLFGSQNNYLD